MEGEIWEAYFQSSVQQLAYATIVIELLKGELEWVKLKGEIATRIKTHQKQELKVASHWTQFVRDFVLHLCLFGYVVYRLVPKGRKNTHASLYEIAPPGSHSLQRDDHSAGWKVQATETTEGKRLKGSKMWHVSILSPPLEYIARGKMQRRHTSAGYKCIAYSQELARIEVEGQRRDEYNSVPTVFTHVSKNLTSAAEGKRPWFKPSALPQYENATAPDAPQDFNALVEDRAEAIQRLDEISEQARNRAQSMYGEQDGQQYSVGSGMRNKKQKQRHRELIISDGREAQTAPYLRAPEHMDKIVQQYEHRIMFAWGVPPQVLGQNINSERTAASNRLSDMAISGFDAHIKIIRTHVQDALEKLTRLISKDVSVYIRIAPCMSAYTLSQLEGILTNEACAETYSCVYQVPIQHIDLDAMRQRQETINAEGAAKERVEQKTTSAVGESASGAEGSSKNRPTMTEGQKDKRAIAKSKKPSSA